MIPFVLPKFVNLARVVRCLEEDDCGVAFELPARVCPACGSEHFMPLPVERKA